MESQNWVKWLRSASTTHIQGDKPPILIVSTPRSGSTWLLETIGSCPGMKPIREPLNLRKLEVPEMLGLQHWTDLYSLKNKDLVVSYLKSFSSSKGYNFRFKREKPFSPTWHMFTNRLVYKILHGGEHMVADLERSLNAVVIFLVRHPIPVSLSRKVAPRVESLLRSDYAKHFSFNQLEYAENVLKFGSDLEINVLDWCLQNKIPLDNWKPSWIMVSYEQMTTHPKETIKYVFSETGLRFTDKTERMLYRASGSSRKSDKDSQSVIFDEEKLRTQRTWLISKWSSKVSEYEKQKSFDILDKFGIDLYERESYLLNPKYQLKNLASAT